MGSGKSQYDNEILFYHIVVNRLVLERSHHARRINKDGPYMGLHSSASGQETLTAIFTNHLKQQSMGDALKTVEKNTFFISRSVPLSDSVILCSLALTKLFIHLAVNMAGG